MYQPRITEPLIRRLYTLAKRRQQPMTRLLDEILKDALERLEQAPHAVHEPPADASRAERRTDHAAG